MPVLNMSKGTYWGEPIATRSDSGLLLTLSQYEPDREYPLHAHDQPGLFFLIRGDHRETDHRQSFRQGAASGIWHDRGFAHATQVGPRGMIGLNISLQPKVFDEMPRQCEERVFESAFCAYLGLRVLAAIKRNLEPDEITGRVWELLAETITRETVGHRRIEQVHRRVMEEYRGTIRLTSLAQDCGLHPVYLARAYRRHYGKSIMEHIHELRLGYALAKVSSGMPAGLAAIEAGFADQPHLNRFCRQLMGHSPTALGVSNGFIRSRQVPGDIG